MPIGGDFDPNETGLARAGRELAAEFAASQRAERERYGQSANSKVESRPIPTTKETEKPANTSSSRNCCSIS
jgi:hypothetical protein